MRPSRTSVATVWKRIERDREAALESWGEEIRQWANRVESQARNQGSHDPPSED